MSEAKQEHSLATVLARVMHKWPNDVDSIRQYATGELRASRKKWPVILSHLNVPPASDWLTASVTKADWGKARAAISKATGSEA